MFSNIATNTNLVMKVRLQVILVDDRVRIVPEHRGNNEEGQQDEQQEEEQPGQQQQGGWMVNNNNGHAQILAYIQHVQQNLVQRLDAQVAEQLAMRAWMQQQFDRVLKNQRHYGGTIYSAMARGNGQEQQRRRLQRQQEAADAAAAAAAAPPFPQDGAAAARNRVNDYRDVALEAKLVDRPKSLHELWEEYQYGIGNNKPAKDFTTAERTNRATETTKVLYNKNKIWRIQSYMLNAGWTVEAMNAKIIEVYGGTVTRIIKGVISDGNNEQYTQW
jgi:hypothetical protein